MLSRVRRCQGVRWFSLGIVVIMSLGGDCTTTLSPGCSSPYWRPPDFFATFTTIATSSVGVRVDLPTGGYDGIWVVVHNASRWTVALSSGLLNVTPPEPDPSPHYFTIDLSPDLIPGEEYYFTVRITNGSVCSTRWGSWRYVPTTAATTTTTVATTVAANTTTTSSIALATPTAVVVISISTRRVTVNVTLSAGTYDGVRVAVGTAGSGSSVIFRSSPVTLTSPGHRSFTMGAYLTPGQHYTVSAKTQFGSVHGEYKDGIAPATVPPSTPSDVSFTSITTSNVRVNVTLSAGRYDGVLVELYTSTGGSAVKRSSGSSTVSDFTLTSEEQRSFTVNSLTPALIPGQHYTVEVKSRSGSVFSVPSPVSAPATVKPPTPAAVIITSISTGSVTVSVTLSAGRYDGVLVELYTGTGESAVLSASSPVSDFTLTSGGQRTFAVNSLKVPLTPGQDYTGRVKTRSGTKSSSLSPLSAPATVDPATPTDVAITSINTTSVTVNVTLSAGRYDGVLVELYTDTGGSAVSSGSSPVSGFTLKSERQGIFTLSSLSPSLTSGQQYTVRVKSRSGSVSSALSPVSDPATVAPGLDNSNVPTIAVSVSCTLLLVILIAVILFLVLRYRNRASKNRTPTEDAGSNHLPMSDYETVNSMTSGKEEKTYEDMRYGQMEISYSRIALFTENMSKGKQGVVRGTFMETNGLCRSIAVHKIKGTRPLERCKAEVGIMRNIGRHPNVVSFLGYSLKDNNTALMVHGYEENKDLQSFLRAKGRVGGETGLTEASLLNFAEDVARGMDHLTRLGILHGDLRAHNILLAGDLTAKVAGLQQARPVGAESKTLSKFPMSRWASIETLERQVYNPWSEIWSFGVLMWEIMTFGDTPYGEMTTKEILNLLRQNCRLTCPKSCQLSFYSLLFDCWNRQPEERPTFEFLSQRLASMVTDVQQYMNIGIYETLD